MQSPTVTADGGNMPTGEGSNVTYLQLLLTPKCYEELFINGNLLNLFCVQLLTSKLIGIAIILLSSVFMKLPQVLKILSSRDSKGVSLFSQLLILITCSTNIGYSLAKDFPFSTWGESIAIGIQTLAICILILIYRDDFKQAVLFTGVYFVGMVVILSPSTPLKVHTYLAMLSVPLNITSRVAQIRLNYVSGGTGQLSALYIFLMNFRSVGRLYTNITETGDAIRIATFSIQCVMNWILATQMLYYKGMIKIRPKLKKG